MLVLAGLGNPGTKYLKTRHNAGFLVLDELARFYKVLSIYEKYQSYCADVKIRRHTALLIKPQTYMNLSGEAVKSAVFSNKIEEINKNLIVIHDDVDLEFGKLRVKNKGGDGGHNGIKSIIAELNTDSFLRIKIGIGRPLNSFQTADYVLDAFSDDEFKFLTENLSKNIKSFIDQYLELGYEKAKSLCEI